MFTKRPSGRKYVVARSSRPQAEICSRQSPFRGRCCATQHTTVRFISVRRLKPVQCPRVSYVRISATQYFPQRCSIPRAHDEQRRSGAPRANMRSGSVAPSRE
jgi:hypothetical protein